MSTSGLAPGMWVQHPDEPDWGRGQIQSVDRHRVTVNFTHAGKRTINAMVISLRVDVPSVAAHEID
ncbi:MAG: DUF3553 domain-containing protein [Chromatiales bacterium]|nr:DUF3553 domain-containing protein [Chromatiales bacterium]